MLYCDSVAFTEVIRSSICLHPCVLHSEPFMSPMREEVPENIYLCVFDGSTVDCSAMHRYGDPI